MALTQIRKEQIKDLTIDNSKIAESAAIAYSKLNLSSSLVASDLNPSTDRIHDAVLDSKLIALWDVVTDQVVSGTSTEVTAKVTTAAQTDTPTDGSPQSKGVLLTGTGIGGEGTTNYKVQIRNSDTKEPVCDNLTGAGSGGTVYGELRHDGTNYRLYYFKSDATPYSFNDAVQVTKINTVSDISNSLDGATFEIDSPTTQYLVWYNTSGVPGSGQPTAPGKTLVEVQINENESAGMVAKKTQIALDSLVDFQASVSEGTAEVTSISTKANVENSLDGKYFKISSINASGTKTDYVIWYGIESNNLPPSVAGTKVKVVLTGANLTASTIATITQSQMNTIESTPFSVSANGDLITVSCTGVGAVPNADVGNSEFFITQLVEGKDPSSSIIVTNTSPGYCPVAHNGTPSAGFTFDLISGGVSKIDFMFVEIYSYFTAPLMSFVTGMGFADVVGVSGTHNHNDLYFSRTELTSGALDNRYYTETELNGGQLDSRYFTKNDLTISGSVSSNVLDARYFTKSQLASTANNNSGAQLIGIEPTGNLSSTNVQAALVEVQSDIDNIISGNINITHSLDDAYDDGSIIHVDDTNVDFQLAAAKKFIVSDSTDTTKLAITAGTDADSVKINTSGGVDIDATNGLRIDASTGNYFEMKSNGVSLSSTANPMTISSNNTLSINTASSLGKISLQSSENSDEDAIKVTANAGGIDIDSSKNIDIATSGGDIKFNDKNLTISIPLTQTGVSALSSNFDNATSIIGAINENADDLHTFVTVTLPSTTDGSSGADKIGATGIPGVIPTGKTLGADGTVQEMLEGIAMSAGGGKTFADITTFVTAKQGGEYFKVNEPVFILNINRWVIVKTQSTDAQEGVDWDYVGDTARVIGGGSFQTVLTDTTPDSFKVDTDGGISLTANGIINIQNSTNTAKMQITAAGTVDIDAAEDQDVNISSDQQVFIEGIGGTSTVKISSGSIDIDTHTGGMTVDVNANQNLTMTTTGTGEIQLTSSDEIKLIGGDVTVSAGLGKSTSISSDTLVGISSDTSILMTGGSIAANAGTGKKVTASSDTAIELSGGPEIDLTATLIDINGATTVDGNSLIVNTTDNIELNSTGTIKITDSGTGANNGISITSTNTGDVTIETTGTGEIYINSAQNVDINAPNINTTGILTQAGKTIINGETTITAPVNKDISLVTSGSTGGVYLESSQEIELKTPITKVTGDLTMTDDAWLAVGNIKITSVDPDDFATISGSRSGTVNVLNKVNNSGFELGSGTVAQGWNQSINTIRTTTDRYYGSFSAKTYIENLQSEEEILETTVDINPSTDYNVSFYIKGIVQGSIAVSLGGSENATIVSGPQNYATWTRVNTTITTSATITTNTLGIYVSDMGGYFNFELDAVMVVEGTTTVDYFTDRKSELIFSIGDEDNDRIVMRSEGTSTRDIVRINQNTVEILGNLQVGGTTTTVNSEDLLVADNQIILNSNVTDVPSLDAYVTVERGTSPNVSIKWNESAKLWELTNDGTNYSTIVTTGGSGSLSLDVAYDGGSTVNVDDTNVDFQLAATKKFIVSDSTDTNKFVITEGTDADSVKINTSGGVDIGFNDNINIVKNGALQSTKIYSNRFNGTIEQINITSGNVILSSGLYNAVVSDSSIKLSKNSEHILLSTDGVNITTDAVNSIVADTGSFSIDGVLASNVSVTGANLTVSTITSGNLYLSSADDVVVSAGSTKKVTIVAQDIKTTGALVQTGSTQIIGDLNLDGSFDQTGNYTFKIDTANTAANSVIINSAGGIDIDAQGTFALTANTITSVGTLGHTGSATITGLTTVVGSLDVDGETVSLTSTGTAGSHLTLTSADKIVVSGVGVDIEAGSGAFTIEGDANSTINVSGGNLSLKTTGSGAVALNSAGALTLKDSILTSAINLSQTNASELSNKFEYNSQTAFDWTSRSTGQNAITSIIGALNANRQDLWEFVELLNTQGAAIGVAAGANLIGCDGIESIIPNRPGASLGDDGTVQEMLEALAKQAGGSCKHFATLQAFLDYKGGTGAYAGKPGYLAPMTQVYIEDIEREIRVLTAGTTGVVEGTDWDYLWGSERPLAGSEFVITSSSMQVNTTGNVDIDTDTGFSVNDDSGSSFIMDSTGSITTTTATGQKFTINSDTEIELNGTLIDVNATTMTIDSALAITAPVDTNVSITTSGTGKVQLNTASEVSLNGGKLTLVAGANGDLVLSTAVGTGKIDINATNAFEVDAGSASHISVAGDLTLQTTVGELYLDDARTSAIPFSDSSNTTLPGGTTSLLGAIQKAYDRVGDTTFIEYEEHTVDSTDVTNDYVVSNITLLPTTGTFPMTPSALRNISGNKVFVSIYLNGLRLTDSEFRYTYQASERRITFDGSDNITLVSGDKLAIEVTKIISSQYE